MDEQGQFLSLKWNNHSSRFLDLLSKLRTKGFFSDAAIACDGKMFEVHKIVLSCCSDYFKDIFEKTDCNKPVIILKDVRHVDLEALLNYMYNGEVNVAKDELCYLIEAAECLKIKGLAVADDEPEQTSCKQSSRKRSATIAADESDNKKQRKSHLSVKNASDSDTVSQKTLTPKSEISKNSNKTFDSYSKSKTNEEQKLQTLQSINMEIEPELISPKSEPVDCYGYVETEGYQEQASSLSDSLQGLHGEYLQEYKSNPSCSQDWQESITSVIGSSFVVGDTDSIKNTSLLQSEAAVVESNLTSNNFNNELSQIGSQISLAGNEMSSSKKSNCLRKVHPCSACPKVFRRKDNLTLHFRTHTGEKPYACPHCDYRTTTTSNVYRHMRNNHYKANISAASVSASSACIEPKQNADIL